MTSLLELNHLFLQSHTTGNKIDSAIAVKIMTGGVSPNWAIPNVVAMVFGKDVTRVISVR